ncbi:MAG: outer membrane beta-barrel protein [Pseudomonadota bacterium]
MRILITAALTALIPSLVAAQSFEGPSVGVQLSYGDVDTSDAAELEGDNALIGARAYFDTDVGGFLLGGGVQYDITEIDLEGVTDIDAVFRIGARGGVQNGGNYFYGTGGFAQAYLSEEAVGDSGGFFVGAGYESFVTDTITAGVEVLYHRFQNFELDELTANVVTVGAHLNYRF